MNIWWYNTHDIFYVIKLICFSFNKFILKAKKKIYIKIICTHYSNIYNILHSCFMLIHRTMRNKGKFLKYHKIESIFIRGFRQPFI